VAEGVLLQLLPHPAPLGRADAAHHEYHDRRELVRPRRPRHRAGRAGGRGGGAGSGAQRAEGAAQAEAAEARFNDASKGGAAALLQVPNVGLAGGLAGAGSMNGGAASGRLFLRWQS
jgi:hypothetical protein